MSGPYAEDGWRPAPPIRPRFRVGQEVGRTIYDGDVLIGMLDTAELAAFAVESMNLRENEAPR